MGRKRGGTGGKKKGKPKVCTYCGLRPAVDLDHVVARAFFDVQPENHVTVPSCEACNRLNGDGGSRDMSEDEEYMRRTLCWMTSDLNHPVTESLLDNEIARSFEKTPAKAAEVLGSVRRGTVRNHAGIYVPNTDVMRVETDRVDRVIRKVTKGLFCRYYRMPSFPPDLDVTALSFCPANQFAEVWTFAAQFDAQDRLGPLRLGDGKVFFFRAARLFRDPMQTLWLMVFYQTHRFIGTTARRKASANE